MEDSTEETFKQIGKGIEFQSPQCQVNVLITRLKSDIQFLYDKYCMKRGEDSAGLKSSLNFRKLDLI